MPRVGECTTLILVVLKKSLKCYVLMGKGFKKFIFNGLKGLDDKSISRSIYFINQDKYTGPRDHFTYL